MNSILSFYMYSILIAALYFVHRNNSYYTFQNIYFQSRYLVRIRIVPSHEDVIVAVIGSVSLSCSILLS